MRYALTLLTLSAILAGCALAIDETPADSATSAAAPAAASDAPALNPKLLELPANQWVRIHEQAKGDKVGFMRQAHGGSCFDTKRGRVVLFGSNTHGRDWSNSPYFFDPVKLEWTQLYPHDKPETYTVNDQGIPVAGEKGDHPWATHTFGAVEYDPSRDEMVVAIRPAHMVPGRFSNALKQQWPKVKKWPTWVLSFKTNTWRPLECQAVHFFPHSTCFDTDRNAVIGYQPGGVYELVADADQPRQWVRRTKKVHLVGWHNNSVYDAKNKAMVTFGHNKNTNDIDAYFVGKQESKLMPTTGDRPAKDQHNPMAFVPTLGKTAVVVDRKVNPEDPKSATVAELWLYDLAADAWTQVKTATLDFGCGMNYTMEWDPNHKCLLLVAGRPTQVWACRVTGE